MAICYKSTGKSYPLEGDLEAAQKTATNGSGFLQKLANNGKYQ